MAQDLPPQGGYEPVQYKVSSQILSIPKTSALGKGLIIPSAQPPRPRSPPGLLSCGRCCHHELRLVQIHQRGEGAEVGSPKVRFEVGLEDGGQMADALAIANWDGKRCGHGYI